jgi:hypothetical protein
MEIRFAVCEPQLEWSKLFARCALQQRITIGRAAFLAAEGLAAKKAALPIKTRLIKIVEILPIGE